MAKKKEKILIQINSVINTGSTGRITEEIGKLAIANGWKSYIAYGRYGRESASIKIKIGNVFSTYWHIFLTRLFDRHGFGSKYATRTLIKKIKQINPDIIHLHNLHGYYIHIGILFKFLAKLKIPIVWTLHDCWTFTGHCSHFAFIGCDKWESQCMQCPQKREYPKSIFLDRSYNNFEDKRKYFLSAKELLTLIPVSDWLAGLCQQSFLKGVPIKRIHNGVEVDLFNPIAEDKKMLVRGKYNIKSKFLILGVATKWSDRKGINDFFALSKLLPGDYFILLVGLSRKQCKNLHPNIGGITRTDNINELVALYSTADVFLNPTREDTFPTTNLEALACGTPVITYRAGGSVESVSEDTGIVVEQGDVEGLYRAIQTVQKNGKSYYSKSCRERALSLYNKNERYHAYMELYENLIINNC
ncbi:MAG: glycosyltransferase [Bacteroidales bacterium]|jgi:glycosyltransferase involved in cell wall biosynthesis|nr:glycosyltransferase [Bacteroidales bacterium]